MKFFFQSISIKTEKSKITLLDIKKIYAVHHHNLKVWRGVDQQWIFSEKGIRCLWVTHEKFQKPETIRDFVLIQFT